MGDEIYIENLKKYSKTINLALNVSKLAASRQAEDKVVWACVLYTKMCVTGLSIFVLTPESEIAKKKIQHWDFSSLFSLTRNLMECYQTMFYLCVDEVSSDELNARRKLFNLHDYYSRKKLFSFMTDKNEDKEIENIVVKELIETDYFKNLDQKQQKYFLKGDNAFFISREEIEARIGTDKNEFKLLYKLFSSNTHSFPMGFYGMLEGERGTGVKSEVEVGYSGLALEIAEQYIRQASNNMIKFFPDIFQQLTSEEKNTLG